MPRQEPVVCPFHEFYTPTAYFLKLKYNIIFPSVPSFIINSCVSITVLLLFLLLLSFSIECFVSPLQSMSITIYSNIQILPLTSLVCLNDCLTVSEMCRVTIDWACTCVAFQCLSLTQQTGLNSCKQKEKKKWL